MLPNVYARRQCNTMYINACNPMYIHVTKCIYVCHNVYTCVPMYIPYIHWVTQYIHWVTKINLHHNVYTVTQCIYGRQKNCNTMYIPNVY